MSARALPDGFRYASDTNTEWMTDQQVRDLMGPEESTDSTALVGSSPR